MEHFHQRGFYDIVVSAKAHDVPVTIETYRLLAQQLPEVPLHIGVTEAGTAFQGIIKSAAGLGVLLEEGIGDTMRISLTDDPVKEVRACWTLLSALTTSPPFPRAYQLSHLWSLPGESYRHRPTG